METGHSVHVLHVDDEPDLADVVAKSLERENEQFVIETAGDASEGLDRLSTDEFDCVVSDYDMPGQNGIEFLRAVREDHPDLPFILYTGKGSEDVASEAISAGVTDYLQKGTGTEQYELLANRIQNYVERAYAESERERQFEAIETAREGISILDDSGQFIYVNEAYADLYGYDSGEMIGEHWALIYPDESTQRIREEILPTVYETGYWHGETVGKRADGSTFAEDHVLATTDADELVCTVRDISEEKEHERRFEAIFSNTFTFTGLMEPDGTLLEANERALSFGGFDQEDVVDTPLWETGWVESIEESKETVRNGVEQARNGELFRDEIRIRGTDREAVIDFTIRPVTDEQGAVTVLIPEGRDVTERQKREQELRETSRRLDLALEATDTGVWEWNVETDEVVWSETLEELLGIEPGAFGGTFEAHAEYLHPDDVEMVEQSIERALHGNGNFRAEFRMQREDGEQIWVEGRGELITEDGSKRMIGTTTDITDRKESELALTRREMLDPSVELEFHSDQLGQTVLEADESDLDFTLEGVVPQSDGTQLLYGTVTNRTAKEFQAILDRIPTTGEARLLSTVGDSARYEVSAGDGSITAAFDTFDGELQSVVVENGTCKLVGKFPETVDPGAVTRAVRETYPDIELASQRRIVTPTYLRRTIEDDLTERQRTVLGMAYYANYFDQPRQSTGDELADRLGITRQTFNSHLRKAQSTVFHALFEKAIDLPG